MNSRSRRADEVFDRVRRPSIHGDRLEQSPWLDRVGVGVSELITPLFLSSTITVVAGDFLGVDAVALAVHLLQVEVIYRVCSLTVRLRRRSISSARRSFAHQQATGRPSQTAKRAASEGGEHGWLRELSWSGDMMRPTDWSCFFGREKAISVLQQIQRPQPARVCGGAPHNREAFVTDLGGLTAPTPSARESALRLALSSSSSASRLEDPHDGSRKRNRRRQCSDGEQISPEDRTADLLSDDDDVSGIEACGENVAVVPFAGTPANH